MTTVGTIRDQTYQWLYSGGKNLPAFDTLASDITSGATSMTLTGLQTYAPQSIVEIDDELILTKEAESSTTVDLNERGYLETDAAAHTAGTKVWFDPLFARKTVFDTIGALVASLHNYGLYRLVQETATTYSAVNPVDLPSGTVDIGQVMVRVGVRWYPLREGRDFAFFPAWSPPKIQFFGNFPSGSTMLINLKKDFTAPSATSQDMTTDLGVPASLVGHFPMGVAGYLLQREELPRVTIEDIKTKLSSEGIQVGSALNVGQAMYRQFEMFVEKEKRTQRERVPTPTVTVP